jgi:hypothetical protein
MIPMPGVRAVWVWPAISVASIIVATSSTIGDLCAFVVQSVSDSGGAIDRTSILNRHIVYDGFTPRFSYVFTEQHSNIALYSYNRNQFQIGLTTLF